MANVFGILTAITLALAAFIGYKNKGAYERQIAEAALQRDNLDKSKKRFQTAQDSLNAAREKTKTLVEVDIANATKEADDQKKANEDMKIEIETARRKVETNTEQLDEIRAKTEQVGEIKELADKMRSLVSEREQLQQSVTQSQATLANLTASNRQADEQAAALRSKLEGVSTGQSLPTLKTRIRSIYPTWGFVTLASGNDSGVITNSTLNVVRDDQTIAQLLVTAVERNSASASIVPDSIAEGVTLMVGDRVVAAIKNERN